MSTRDAVEAAFDKLDGGGEEAAQADETPAVAAPAESATVTEEAPAATKPAVDDAGAKPRTEKGQFAKTKKAKAAEVEPTGDQAEDAAKAEAQAEEATQDPAVDAEQPKPTATKPPQSWRPAAREKWATLPQEVQQEALRREKEVSVALQEASQSRKFESEFQKVVAPFSALIHAGSGDPLKTFGSLMQTAAALQLGAPAQKVAIAESILGDFGVPVGPEMVARIIKRHGVSVEALDKLLAGEAPPPDHGQHRPPAAQQMDPNAIAAQVRQQLQREFQAQQHQGATMRAQGEVEAFVPGAEFLESLDQGQEAEPGSVRDLMAQELELDARLEQAKKRRGERHVAITLEQAYSRACQRHPEVSDVLRRRDAAKQAGTAQAATQRARAAASSVRTQPAGVRQAPQPKDTRSAVEAAWDSLAGEGR